jgi:hypothetical protein
MMSPNVNRNVAAMALLTLAAWLIQRPLGGIQSDAVLYTLFALAKLHPDTLSADIFLHFGSQDRFTLFSPIYAGAISELGLERAASLLLVVSYAALLACAWLIARRFMSALDATLGVALLIVLPDEFGQGSTFHYLEPVITARPPAEALVLGVVLAALTERYWIAVGCLVAGIFIHPLMTLAGAVLLLVTCVLPRHPRLTLGAAAVGFLATLGIVIAIAPLGRITGVDWWYSIHWTSSYLFITKWQLVDWSRTACYLVVLIVGCWVGGTPLLRRICAGLLGTVALGMLVTLVFCDGLHVALFVDLQAWRWLWLAEVLSVVMVPAIARDCWQRGYSGRIAVVALAVAWLLRDLPAGLLAGTVVIGCAAVPREWNRSRYWRSGFGSACVLLGLIICLNLATRSAPAAAPDAQGPALLQEIRSVCHDGIIPAMVLIALWSVLRAPASHVVQAPLSLAIAATATATCVVLLPSAWENFNTTLYTPESANRFTQWRAAIPPRAEVLWLDNPVATWYFLDRPSYLSGQQLAGAIFSREKALLAQRRIETITAALRPNPSNPHGESDVDKYDKTRLPVSAYQIDLTGARTVCADPDLKYIVSANPVAPSPFTPVTVETPSRNRPTFYLYRCADLRS